MIHQSGDGKIGIPKMTRSFVLSSLGGAIFFIACIVVIKNLQGDNLLPDESTKISNKDQTHRKDRKAGNTQSLLDSHNSSLKENISVTPNEEMISQIVGSGRSAHDIATDLLKLLPESKGSEQTLVASHLSNLAEGEQLDQLVSYLSDPRINKKSKEEIFNSIYQCEPKQTASLLIQVIDNGVQEYASEAEQGLSILLQADHGMDVAAWKSELNKTDKFLESEKIQE